MQLRCFLGEISFYCQFRFLHNFDIYGQVFIREIFGEVFIAFVGLRLRNINGRAVIFMLACWRWFANLSGVARAWKIIRRGAQVALNDRTIVILGELQQMMQQKFHCVYLLPCLYSKNAMWNHPHNWIRVNCMLISWHLCYIGLCNYLHHERTITNKNPRCNEKLWLWWSFDELAKREA